MRVAKYIRVSTEEQNTARQESEFVAYVDKCSGIIPFKERGEAGKLLNELYKYDEIRVHSIDRLGRNAIDIQRTIDFILSRGVNIHIEDLSLSAIVKDKPNPVFKLISDLMANIAQMERDSIKARQAEGIAIARAKGVYKRSRERKTLNDKQILKKHAAVVNCLKAGMSLSKTADTTGVSRTTVIKVKKTLNR
jgi:DNA invertase Pin-like site-specific DNA recombinase